MGRGGNGQDEAQRQHDAAIWKTLLVNELSDVNRFHEVETVPVLFAPQLAPDERFVAAGHFQLYDYGAVGDGTVSYTHLDVYKRQTVGRPRARK